METIYKIKNKRKLQKILICDNFHISNLEHLKKEYHENGNKFEYYKQTWRHKTLNLKPTFYIFPAHSYIILEGTKSSILKLEKKINVETISLGGKNTDVFNIYLKYCKNNGFPPKKNSNFLA